MKYPKRLIEVDLPIKRISAHARREKSIRHGHICTLHIWWARRPLAACRAVICASLWPDPSDEMCPGEFRKTARELMTKWAKDHLKLMSEESSRRFIAISKDDSKLDDNVELRKALLDFIADFANWDNSTVPEYLETSRLLTQTAHEALGGEPGSRPLVVDPFAGGGSIPIEALRVGANVFASDLNPIAVLLNKVVIEYLPKYGQKVADGVRKYGHLVKEYAEKELAELYPKDSTKAEVIAYLWARFIICEGPVCGVKVPLLRSLWLSKKNNNSVGLKILTDKNNKQIEFRIIQGANSKEIGEGTVKRGSVTCPICGYTTPVKSVRSQLKERDGGTNDAFAIAVVLSGESGLFFRPFSREDLNAASKATKELSKREGNMSCKNISLIPNEEVNPLPHSVNRLPMYGMNNWRKIYTHRQSLALATFIKIIRSLDIDNSDKDFKTAIRTCLALAVGRCADYGSSLATWAQQFVAHSFGRQALPFITDFAEVNVLSGKTGSWTSAIGWISNFLEREQVIKSTGDTSLADATEHPLPDDIVNLLATDPPYYDAISYADLSDYFYVWLRRCLYDIHPELFKDEQTEKKGEIIVEPTDVDGVGIKDNQYYLDKMVLAMTEIRRILAPNGVGVIVFAHKTTVGWESQLSAMLTAGLSVTASWPIDTERPGKVSAIGQARLMSSIHLVCRPRENPDGSLITDYVGDWRDVLAELPKRIHEWMPRLAKEGVVGADAIFACLGPALEIYSRYSSVEKASGEKVELKEYLEQVWAAVSREALKMIFEGADASGFEEDARLTAMWLWTLRTAANGNNKANNDAPAKSLPGYRLEYDAARKIAQGLGAHLENLSHLVEIKGNTAMLLSAGARTRYLFGKDAGEAPKGRKKKKSKQLRFDFEGELKQIKEESGNWAGDLLGRAGSTVLDQLHQSMILFGAGRGEALKRFLVDDGIGKASGQVCS